MIKILNSSVRLPKKLAIDTIRAYTTNSPSKVAINSERQYLACWTGNQEVWLDVIRKCYQSHGAGLPANKFDLQAWSIIVAPSRESIESTWQSYFYSTNPVFHFREAISLYITSTGFKF